MESTDDIYKKYGIDNSKKPVDKARLEKVMDDIAYCREHLSRINETREALFHVLDQLPAMHNAIIKMGEQIGVLAKHVIRLEQVTGLEEYDREMAEKNEQSGGVDGGH